MIYECEPLGRFHVEMAGKEQLVFLPCAAIQALCEAPGPMSTDVLPSAIIKMDI